ncbi:MAG: ribonuclease HI family protein [Acetobacteraceae bacterium]|nr:ribonuclease HI family protein [Acetobacteraceae bacterium]
MPEVLIFTDGAARGNPGEAGIGIVLCSPDGSVVAEHSEYIGLATNNAAEYWAVIRGLEDARARGFKRVKVIGDSELLIRQLQGTYKVRNPGLKPLHARVEALMRSFAQVELEHLSREKNRQADRLANQAIDRVIRDSVEAAAQVATLGTAPTPPEGRGEAPAGAPGAGAPAPSRPPRRRWFRRYRRPRGARPGRMRRTRRGARPGEGGTTG